MTGVRLGFLNDVTPVVAAGVRALLAPFQNRVQFVGHGVAPDVVFADMSGVQHAVQIPHLEMPLVAFARADDLPQLRAAGAHAVLLSAPSTEIVAAIEAAHSAGRVATASPIVEVTADPRGRMMPLSARERQVMDAVCRGMSNQQLADSLCVSVNSVKTYIRSAYRKIGVQRRGEAIVWGLSNGFGQQDHPNSN